MGRVLVERGVDPLVGGGVVAGVEEDVEAFVPDDVHDVVVDDTRCLSYFGALIPSGDGPPVFAVEGVEVGAQLLAVGELVVGGHAVSGAETPPQAVAEADDLSQAERGVASASQADLHMLRSEVRQAEHRDRGEVDLPASSNVGLADALFQTLEHVLDHTGGLHRPSFGPGDLLC